MAWSLATMRALGSWLGPETAYKSEPAEDDRFYEFVAEVWREERRVWDEALAEEVIRKTATKLHPEWPADLTQEFVAERRSQGTMLLEFLAHLERLGKLPT